MAAIESARLSTMMSTALATIRRERGDSITEFSEVDEEQPTVQSLYRRTMQTFSPRRQQGTAVKRKRGRPRKSNTLHLQMFLLDQPMDNVPSSANQKKLVQLGFGMPRDDTSNYFMRSWDVDAVQNHIISAFPDAHLDLVGFHFKRSSKTRCLNRLDFESMEKLKKDIRKGKLYIVPNRLICGSINSDEDLVEEAALEGPHRDILSIDVAVSDQDSSGRTPATPSTSRQSIDVAVSDQDSSGRTPATPSTSRQESRVQRNAATAAREEIRGYAQIIMGSRSNISDISLATPRTGRPRRNRLSRRMASPVQVTVSGNTDNEPPVDSDNPAVQTLSENAASGPPTHVVTDTITTVSENAASGPPTHVVTDTITTVSGNTENEPTVDSDTPAVQMVSENTASGPSTHVVTDTITTVSGNTENEPPVDSDTPPYVPTLSENAASGPPTHVVTDTITTLNENMESGISHIDAGTPTVQFRNRSETVSETAPDDRRLEMDISAALLNLQKSCLGEEERTLSVTRTDIVTDMLQFYSDPSVLNSKLHVEFLGEPGDDFGGLTKEVFTLFWREATKTFFLGEQSVVPYLALHLQRRDTWKFVSLGRILAHTVLLTGGIPPNLSISCLINIIFDCEVDEDFLFNDFLLFLTDREKSLVSKAVNSFDLLTNREVDRLTSLYTAYKFLDIPRKSTIKQQLFAIADQELVQKPQRLCTQMRKGIPNCHLQGFWGQLSVDHLSYMLHKQRPTAEKVACCLVSAEENITNAEDTAFYYLKEYISSMSEETLLDFLLFCTGSVHQPEEIKVSFTGLSGAQRRPIAHTCSNVLEIPTTYDSFQEFRKEFNFLLSTTEAFEYSSA